MSSSSLLSGTPAAVSPALVTGVGAAPASAISFYGKSPAVAQQFGTGAGAVVAAPVVAAGAGAAVLEDTTFGAGGQAYSIGQIVAALRAAGILA